ncbi:MAG: FecR domain-containing protein [Vicinamibacteria bacterium]
MAWVKLLRWSKVLAIAGVLSFAVTLTASAEGGRSEEQVKKVDPATEVTSPQSEPQATDTRSDDDYVVVLNAEDNSPVKVYQKYLDKADFWRELTEYNLLDEGVRVRVPKHMLKAGQIPAKISKFSGQVQIARHFDWQWVPVVDNMLVSEGDWVRTRSRSSVEILQDDGTVIKLRPNSKAMISLAGQTKTERGEVRVTQVKLESGSMMAKVNKLLQRESRFEIETPTATSFVRGTEFRVKVEGDQGATRLEVLEGAVDFGSAEQSISVGGNFGSIVNAAGNAPVAAHALPMPPAELFTPTEREVLSGPISSYRFSWAAVNGALRYHLEISADSEFKMLMDETWVSGTDAELMSLSIDSLEPGTYFWRVAAIDADGYESAWSAARYFVYPLQLQ